jgi:hypothetical protein
MRRENSLTGKTSDPTCLLPRLFLHICKCVVSVLLFVVVSSWFSVLWIVSKHVGSLQERRKGGTDVF